MTDVVTYCARRMKDFARYDNNHEQYRNHIQGPQSAIINHPDYETNVDLILQFTFPKGID